MGSIYAWLREPTGETRNMAVDGSTTPVKFRYTAPGRGADIHRALVHFSDGGTFDAELYGNGITLTTGLEVKVLSPDGVTVRADLLDGEAILSNADWQSMSYDFNYNSIGIGNNTATIRWTFAKSGAPLRLAGGEEFAVFVNDNLSGLTSHYVMLQGQTVG